MKKLMLLAAVFAATVASAEKYQGELYEYTKATASSKTSYVTPANVYNVSVRESQNTLTNWWNNRDANGVGAYIQDSAYMSLQPKVVELTEVYEDYEINPIDMVPGAITTVMPAEGTNFYPGAELGVRMPIKGLLRNFETYLPNEPGVCMGLPVGFTLEMIPADVKKVYINNNNWAHKLPAKITLKQPYSRLVIGEITELDDGTDWSPIITAAHLKWNGSSIVADGSYLLEGTNLHSGVSLKYAYRISGGSIVTNEVAAAPATTGYMPSTFYNYITGIEYKPASGQEPSPSGGTSVDVTIIYENKCGQRPAVFTTSLEMLTL